ncbi:uncharacterized protein N7483_005812 [Penicillium malachiteum]|uniref:uncharacterized protein n=1 Tax=Penicillium malachiteum TaxID=1324776 RepID=UPI0025480ACE|nr:uncharacterized protein N7483_005812 [Penicillium malachiteum]KAJ5731304.1 hypothetical protein N7483_005812 [Penicillium malachiteum]
MSSSHDMKNPPTTKKKNMAAKDILLGLTPSEARLLLLGSVYSDSNGRIDFEKVAGHGGTVSSTISAVSAKTMHLKARRKLQNALGVDLGSSASSSTHGQSTSSPSRSTVKGRKPRPKVTSAETSDTEDTSMLTDTAPKTEPESDSEPDVLSPGPVSPKVHSEDEDVVLPDPPAGLCLSDDEV